MRASKSEGGKKKVVVIGGGCAGAVICKSLAEANIDFHLIGKKEMNRSFSFIFFC